MKTAALAIALVLGLAACKAGNEQTATPAAPAEPATSTPAAAVGEPLPEALPQGFALAFPYHFTKREIIHPGRKDARLRYTVEYLEGDPASIASSLGASARAAGFTSTQAKRFGDGRLHFIARKTGYGQLRAEIKPAGDRKLSNAAARGTVVMGWPAEGSADAGTDLAVDAAATDPAAVPAAPADATSPAPAKD